MSEAESVDLRESGQYAQKDTLGNAKRSVHALTSSRKTDHDYAELVQE